MTDLDKIRTNFEKKHKDLACEFHDEGTGIGIIVRYKASPDSFISATLSNSAAYIDMFSVKKQGYGTKLMIALIETITQLGAQSLSAHITHINVLKMLKNIYGEERLQLFKKGLFARGDQITYEEAARLASSGGFILHVKI